MSDLLAYALYGGSFVVPCVYLLATGFQGAQTRAVFKRLAIHLFSCGLVWAFVYYSWQRGDTEYYWLWALLIPVNLIFLLVYIWALGKPNAEQDSARNRSTDAYE